ncbi:glycosyltransferase [Butyricicoccus faecihominis]|uniref:glycosyltransferase n=1 Tax=Butyricicoccus faecihominis TaxID=1712515 RepID=UPI002478B423|nr:glycosyltransferase [Butyricicoccus faecihominis]MCQ5129396.1 glycosyltransferase [Butyricicoccus faecihominis]
MELITVIILSYGESSQYKQTLLSVLGQDYPNIELIISDDASETFEQERIQKFIEQNRRGNIQSVVVRKNANNVGIPRHNNITASLAHGEYIKFIADGDRFVSSKSLRTLRDFAILFDEDIVTSPCIVTDAEHKHNLYMFPSKSRIKTINLSPNLFEVLAYSNILSAVGMLYKRTFFCDGGFDESYYYLEDWPTWLRVARTGKRIPCYEAPIMRYALSGISSKGGSAFESSLLRPDMILCYHKEIFPYSKQLSKRTMRAVNYQYRYLCGKLPKWSEWRFVLKRIVKRTIKKLIFCRSVK